MPTVELIMPFDSDNTFGDVPWTNADSLRLDDEDGLVAVASGLNSGSPSTSMLQFALDPATLSALAPDLTQSTQVTGVTVSAKASITDNSATFGVYLDTLDTLESGLVMNNSLSFADVEMPGPWVEYIANQVIALVAPLLVGVRFNSTPPIGSVDLSLDCVRVLITYSAPAGGSGARPKRTIRTMRTTRL